LADLIYGINPVAEALRGARRRARELYCLSQAGGRLRELQALAAQSGLPVRQLSREELDRRVGHSHHQGVALLLEGFQFTPLPALLELCRQQPDPLLLVLDGITDPHNLGAILRSAEGAGCQGVVVPRDRSCPLTSTVEKTAAGALAHLPICQVTNLARTLEELKAAGFWNYGLAGDAGSSNLYATDLLGSLALVIGSEGKGLRPNVRRHCDGLLAIPMQGQLSSLNVSVATAVALFEVVRQKGTGDGKKIGALPGG